MCIACEYRYLVILIKPFIINDHKTTHKQQTDAFFLLNMKNEQ